MNKKMAKVMTKREVIKSLDEVRQKIVSLITPLNEEKWCEVFLGKWTVADFVGHLIGWDIWGRKATKEILQGKLPSYYADEEPDWVRINDKLVKNYKKGNKKDLLAAVKKSHTQLLAELKKVPEKLLDKDFNIRFEGKKITLTSDTMDQALDEEIHLKQVRNWLKTGKIQ